MLFAAVSCKEPHVHEFSKEWTSDASNHWHECECGEKADEVAHVYGDPQVKGDKVVHVCDECDYEEEIKGAVAVGTEEALKKAIEDGVANIYLSENVDLHEGLVIRKSVKLDLNGKKLENVVALDSHPKYFTVLSIVDGASLILRNGTIKAMDNDCYAINVKNGELVVESGKIIGNVSAIQVQKGKLKILGGEFSIVQTWPTANDPAGTLYTINCIDANYKDGTAVVSIEGGLFKNFNPMNCFAEGANTNFLADGYKTTSKDIDGTTWWTVEKN